MYARLVGDLNAPEFREAVDEIILNDDWFPTVARIREVVKSVQDRKRVFITGGELTVYDEIERVKNTVTTWSLPRHPDGTPDMEAFYQESRRLRGLPPGDDRPRGVAGWNTIGQLMRKELVEV